MALTIAQKSSIRRHLNYPAVGLYAQSPGGGTLGQAAAGWRYHEAYGFLEYKMNNFNPDEEARLTGLAFGAVALVGPQPNGGDTLSVTFSGGPLANPVTVTVTAGAPVANQDNRVTLCNALAAAVSLNATMQAAGFVSLAPYGTGPVSQNAVAIAEVGFRCPQAFTLAASGTGVMAPQITATGAFLSPWTSFDGKTSIYGYVPILDNLEAAYGGTTQNLDTIQADVWKGRWNELGQRLSLYEVWVDKLVDFTGIPRNPRRKSTPAQRGALRYA